MPPGLRNSGAAERTVFREALRRFARVQAAGQLRFGAGMAVEQACPADRDAAEAVDPDR